MITLIGGVALSEGRQVELVRGQKAASIIAILALSDRHESSREKLCSLLWPDTEPDKARTTLRQTLKRMRDGLADVGLRFFEFGRDTLRIIEPNFETDISSLLRSVEEGRLDDGLLSGDIVAEEYLRDLDGQSSSLDAWIAVQRTLFSDRLTAALLDQLRDGDPFDQGTIEVAKALTAFDPTNEKAQCALMHGLAVNGQSAAAIRVYDDLYRLLEDDYDIEPSTETTALIAKIKLGEISGGAADDRPKLTVPAAPQPRSKPVIALRPFARPEGSAISPLARSFYQDLVAVMVRFREWIVVDNFVDDGGDGYYLLEGTEVAEAAQTGILSVVLKSQPNGQFLWSERFPIAFEKWQTSQWKIAQRFAISIGVNLTLDRLNRRARALPRTEAVFDRWLNCQHLISNWTPENGRLVAQTLREITEIDPDFAPAHSELAALYNSYHLVFTGAKRTRSHAEAATRHARIALDIDPLDTRSQRTLAWALLMDGQAELAEIHFDQALDLNETNPYTAMSAAQGLAFCGRVDRACGLATIARTLQPSLPGFLQGYRVGIAFLSGDFESAVDAAEVAEDAISNLRGWKASALWALGKTDAAQDAADAFVEVVGKAWCGDRQPGREGIYRWFADAFPIIDVRMRRKLNEGLRSAMRLDTVTYTG